MSQPGVAERPITEELPALMRSHAVTYRALGVITREIDPAGRGLTHGHIANLASGHERPSRRALELLAAAFDLQAGYFAEHRLAELRDQLDERRVGFDAAYQRYRTLTRARVAGTRCVHERRTSPANAITRASRRVWRGSPRR